MTDDLSEQPLWSFHPNDPSDNQLGVLIDQVRSRYSEDSTVAAGLANILVASGKKLTPPGDFVSDVASTGGPSSLSTLVSPLFLRAAGAVVPKLSVPGRPAGGIDCLAQIPGYRTALSESDVMRVLSTGGYAHFLATGDLAPLDGKMFRMRQRMGAQTVPTLVVASLLSKKIAVGVRSAGLDIRVAPHGNFGSGWVEAARNSHLFIETAKILGIDAFPVLTDGAYPCQPYMGRRESLLALHAYFNGCTDDWLLEHFSTCLTLALVCCPPHLRSKASEADRSELRKHFDRNLADQGAEPDGFDRIAVTTRETHNLELLAERDGFCSFPLQELRDAMVGWQRERISDDDPFPDPVGLIFLQRPGTWVERGAPLATARIELGKRDDVDRTLRSLVCRPTDNPTCPGLEAIIG